ncbi:hypothetical protein BBW65_07385 [Helicobacter enhydrae]|uniref:Conjugal transfer protein TraF n=1 Tax=Helicobacter enhydrae TaxID=222136 RepID=A0A1B1U784_9HELI|nr:conjugal transfer protein TraF [Helicobacter enhydrae]ANV98629.1 hypothetical protein BBW65_07385 [Helicobacter enhydrae]
MARIFLILFAPFVLWALGFAPMGGIPSSIGGTGVAVRSGAWGLYYNPALLSSDPRSKFGYSAGFWITKSNINKFLSLGPLSGGQEIEAALDELSNGKASMQVPMGFVVQMGDINVVQKTAQEDQYGRLVYMEDKIPIGVFAMGAFAVSESGVHFAKVSNTLFEMQQVGVSLLELPFGYAYEVVTDGGRFDFGVALKYMRAAVSVEQKIASALEGFAFETPDFLNGKLAQSFGVDLGFLYSYKDFHLGLTAKNVNFPRFKLADSTAQMLPSVRVGTSYEFLENYTFALDADVLPDQSFGMPRTQYVSLGFLGEYRYGGFGVGACVDIFDVWGSKISVGGNLLGLIQIIGELGINFAKVGGRDLYFPTNFGLKVGGSFSF